jgi:hypothetical protein
MFYCSNCGADFESNDIDYVSPNGLHYCDDCVIECKNCGNYFGEYEGYEGYCPECICKCKMCEGEMTPSEFEKAQDGLCEGCQMFNNSGEDYDNCVVCGKKVEVQELDFDGVCGDCLEDDIDFDDSHHPCDDYDFEDRDFEDQEDDDENF